MDIKIKMVLLSLGLILNGCATVTKSTLLGAAIGGLAGGMIGQHHSQNEQGTTTGLAIGAGLGSLIGYLSFKDKESKQSKVSLPNSEDDIPFLTRPKIRSVIIPDTIEGNKFIKSHKVYILDDAGSWSK